MNDKNESSTDFQDQRHLKELFDKLDKDKDGKIDFQELNEFYNSLKNNKTELNKTSDDAKLLFDKISSTAGNPSVSFEFNDLVEYIIQKDKKIRLYFNQMDKDQNGMIDKNEIKNGFAEMGIILTQSQIDKLLEDLDHNGELNIDWNEWRDFFRFAPHDKLEEILRYWRNYTFANYSIPHDYTNNEKQTGLWWRNLVAGGVAGIVSRTCTAPLDRVKIFMQVHGTGKKNSILGSIKLMIQEGGVRALWRGNLINAVKNVPEMALKFAAYEQIKRVTGKEGVQLEPLTRFYAGTLAGWFAQSTIYPMEVLKTRLALRQTGQYSGVIDCLTKIYKTEGGIKAFYRGYVMNTLGIAGIGVDFMIYETLKSKYKNVTHRDQPSVPALILISNVSSTCGMFSTYPLYLIRTKMQASADPSKNILTLSKEVLAKDGPIGFYKGASANLAKVLPASCIGYLTYEYVSQKLGVPRN